MLPPAAPAISEGYVLVNSEVASPEKRESRAGVITVSQHKRADGWIVIRTK